MSTMNSLKSQTLAASFLALTAIPGIWTLATTPVTGLGTDMIAGATQRQYEERFDDAFPLRDAMRTLWAAAKFGALNEMALGAVAGPNGTLFTSEEFSIPAETRDFAAELDKVSAAINATGAELIPVIIPDKARMMPQALGRARSEQFDARYDLLLAEIKQAGLRTVDLRQPLSVAGSFMATDTHWSPEGALATAQSLASLVGSEIETRSEFETRQVATTDFEGDLLVFADTGPWRRWVGPASETIAVYETTQSSSGDAGAGLGLFDEVTVPVALVGTSFSARPDFNFTGFLKSELSADVISYAVEGRGPFVPMDDFLTSETLTQSPPQIVLWEIPERYLVTWSQNQ